MDMLLSFTLVSFHVLFPYTRVSASADTITRFQFLNDGSTLLSKGGSFEMGFFSPGTPRDRYLGIWYKQMTLNSVVWSANQHKPINGFSGMLMINSTNSNVVLLSDNNVVVWSIKPRREAQNPVLKLLDSGNLVLKEKNDENPENYLWQSIEDHSRTLTRRMNLEITVTKNQNDPSSLGHDPSGLNEDSYCDYHRVCGANGNCDLNRSPACVCLNGFTPHSPRGWDLMDYTQGCVRNKPLNCSTDGFVKYDVFQVPSGTYSLLNQSLTEEDCKAKCMSNCSCVAYTTGSDCKLWTGDLFDVRVVKEGGQGLYIRMPASEVDTEEESHGRDKPKIVGVIVGTTIAIISGMILGFYYMRRRRTKWKGNVKTSGTFSHINEQQKDVELPLLDLSTIAAATDDFSLNNKLGEGGFGSVYKGTLDDGQQIAVKRLSSGSGQGLKEFKNEVILIAKLQHRNLVKLIGCCIQDEEKLLIYEFMPNRSLDYFIFDQTRGKLLDWPKRFNIICGIARGLLYLHQDSRLRVVHRDIKSSNVLLDSEMNPKISDFGLARSFGGDQSKGNTKRIAGTFGYMAPEYAINGHFSVKSDVFSFGILLLELITGKKNRGFYLPNDNINLIGHAGNLWKQERSLELIDECLKDSWTLSEVQRCIHISLLCAQQHPQDRPNMSSVVLMLGSEIDLPQPKFPGFFIGEPSDGISSSSCSNELSITVLEVR